MSSGYKNYIADKGLNDETNTSDGVALIRICGTSPHNNKVVQVEAVRFLMSSSYFCLISLYMRLGLFTTVLGHV